MYYHFTPYIVLLFISTIILTGLVIYGIIYSTVRGAKVFAINMIIGILWCVGNILEMTATNLDIKLFWANMQYISYCFAPVTWLILVFKFTDKEEWVNRKNLLLMSIIPVLSIILVWTNKYHGLMRYNVYLDTSGSLPVIAKEYGWWFWVHFAQTYILNLFSIILLLRAVWKKNTIYQKQSLSLLIGLGLIMFVNILYVAGLTPFSEQDITPVIFSISGLIIGWGIFRYRLFDIVPIARTTVIEEMATGVLVIDRMNRIIDINPRAREMFNIKEISLGKKLIDISKDFLSFLDRDEISELYQEEISFKKDNSTYYYEMYVSPLRDYREDIIARVIIVNDITDLKLAREQINNQREELAVMDERERMARDLHDNLGQILSFANVQIQAIRNVIKKGNKKQGDEYLKRLSEIVRNAHKEIREYVYNVRDNTYYKVKLIDLINNQIKTFKETTDIDIKVDIEQDLDLSVFSIEEKMQIDNILKEALTNILKHSSANCVNIKIEYDKGDYRFIIEDNGDGISSEILNNKKIGSGFSIMNERAKLINGNLKIESQPGRGTRLIFLFSVK